nr:ATP-binding protein [Flavobacterium sp. P3160]
MIDGVLHYSKLGNEQDPLETVDLNEIIAAIKTDLEILIDTKKALITTSNLPSIEAHFTLVYQLFYNLILNSLKFAKSTEPSRIEITSDQISNENGNYLMITITDNGIGFRPEQSESIFDTFTRLNSADKYEGSGLGLALCKKIMERYKGTITATAEPNNGAVFTLLLPL